MADAAGRPVCELDIVAFTSTGARGRVLESIRRTRRVDGTLQVQRADGALVDANPGDVAVVDRSWLRAGSVVASASDPGGQLGVVTAAATALDLVVDASSSTVVAARGVAPAELRRVRELSLGDYVVLRGGGARWLGRVVEVCVDVDVLFDGGDGGAVCRVADAGRKLIALDKDFLKHHTNCRFYPGQRVVGRSSDVFKASRWLNGYWKPSRKKGTVIKLTMTGALVYWLASPRPGGTPPPAYQHNIDDLTFFSSPKICYWSVGDRCFFRNNNPHDNDSAGDHESPSSSSAPPAAARGLTQTRKYYQKSRQMRRPRRVVQPHEFERPMTVADTHTVADVLWQDGTRQRGVPSASLVPFPARNQHDFFPGQHVRRAWPPVVAGAPAAAADVGVVRSLDCKDRTVRVSWFKKGGDETLSAYHLASLGRNVFYGEVVVRVDGDAAGSTTGTTEDDLSWVGRIVDICDTRVQVKWGDGNTTKVLPREIAVVKEQTFSEVLRRMGSLGDWVHDDGSVDSDAQDEVAQVPPAANNTGEGEDDESSSGSDNDDDGPAVTRMMSRVSSVIQQAVVRLGNRFRVSGQTVVDVSGSEPAATANVEASVAVPSGVGDAKQTGNAVEADATGSFEASRFLRFDVAQSPQDHHYLDNSVQGTTSGGRKWTKRVQREWKILENDIPDTIYVRAFEDRMDLLRAVMVGASGTPYHDGLFFFDLQLPPSYPAAPPLVSYRSFGLRLNPNLYESGTVCLSLLDTFGGHGSELWSPETSTLLQVLVSIQGLVLTAQPYYNETGYEAQVGTPLGRRNELPYSENTYLLTLQTVLHLLRRPPVGFEDFVRDHFRRRGRRVLRACQAYMEGCLVGTLDDEARAMEAGSRERPCSAGFRLALASIVPRLAEAFAEIGADGCEQFDLPPVCSITN
ncbi:hypothetical protein EJB05_00139, partial [Eragrostis curvula]